MLSLLSSILACNTVVASGYEVTIHNVDELVHFSEDVNNGIVYNDGTVLLDSDIDLKGIDFYPIGNTSSTYFPGIFDGQGHTISNLNVKTTSNISLYVGLFGYSEKITVQNVILDSTCSIKVSGITSSYANFYAGGIIGKCGFYYEKCDILNSVNMASVTFSDSTGKNTDLYIGGIAGEIYSRGYDSIMKNCANYGTVTYTGDSYKMYIGGIVGYTHVITVQNCLNYGNISYSGEYEYLYMGGIIGANYYSIKADNCVSAGSITHKSNSVDADTVIGVIAGYTSYDVYITNCYWSDEVSIKESELLKKPLIAIYNSKYEYGITKFNSDFVLNESVFVGKHKTTSLIDALNAGAELDLTNRYSHWLLNKNEESVTFVLNSDNNITTFDYQLIILPEMVNRGNYLFDGWYTDSDCTEKSTVFVIDNSTILYGLYSDEIRSYTVTFDTRGGSPSSVEPITAGYLSTVELPRSISKDGYIFACWETEDGYSVSMNYTMPNRNVALYAVWMSLRITNAEELIAFSDAVNSGISDFNGKTVYLDNDIVFTDELSPKFNPIGKYDRYSYTLFNGVFDGQGHTIKNLTIYGSDVAGLFGYSRGATIRNVVMDESCTFKRVLTSNYYNGGVGSILGLCRAEYAPCIIENCVNKMNIKYSLNSDSINIGGIVGEIRAYDVARKSIIKNCVNYGSISITGDKVHQTIYAGGIVGEIYYATVSDCTNYGDLTFNGTARYSSPNLRGITGFRYDTSVKNCKNYGTITNVEPYYKSSKGVNVGAIVGYVFLGVGLAAIVVVIIVVVVRYLRRKGKDNKNGDYEKMIIS